MKNVIHFCFCFFFVAETRIGRKDADPVPNVPLSGLR